MKLDHGILNVPNALTLARLAALPFIIMLSRTERALPATALFVVVALSDCLDGWLARRLNQCTRLGIYLDPVVDKVVVLVLFYELAHAGLVPLIVPHLFLLRELLQNAIRNVAATQGTVVGANWMGKTKFTLQTICITGALLLPVLGRLVYARELVVTFTWVVLGLAWAFFSAFVWRNRRSLN